MTSKMSWQKQLRLSIVGLRTVNSQPKVAVVGVGHELRGDDGAGVAVARLLNCRLNSPLVQVIEAGAAPENCSGQLLRFQPDLIIFVDAAQMGERPGTIRWLDWDRVCSSNLAGFNSSTHTLPLYFLANYLEAELGCQVGLLGIQPADTSMNDSLSPALTTAVEITAGELLAVLQSVEGAVER